MIKPGILALSLLVISFSGFQTEDIILHGEITTPAYCLYNNDLYYKTDFGALYNWFSVNTGKLYPEGWHVPSYHD